jgi:hypothetical protein
VDAGSREENAGKAIEALVLIQPERSERTIVPALAGTIRGGTLRSLLSMISAQMRSAFVARENRIPRFRIML